MFCKISKEQRKLSLFYMKEKQKQSDNMNFSNREYFSGQADNRNSANIMANKYAATENINITHNNDSTTVVC